MKKALVLLLVLLTGFACVYAGGESESKNVESPFPQKSIAVVYSSFSDQLGSEFKGSLESLAGYFNIKFNFVETGFNQEEGQSKTDAMLQTKPDGVIFVSANVANLESAYKMGQIPVIALNEPVDQQTADALLGYSNYLGAVVNNDYEIGVRNAKALYDAGCRNICVTCLTPGTSKNHEDRLRGFKDTMVNYPDMKILSENASRAQWSAAINTFAAAFPEMDGLFMTACNEPAYQAIKKNGLVGKVKIAAADVSESTVDYLDNGTIISIFGGQYNKIMLAFAALYNYIYDGTRILDEVNHIAYTPFLQITSPKDFQIYQKYVTGGGKYVYSSAVIASLIKGLNPEMNGQKFADFCAAYSINQVIKSQTN